jgi:hypothetical protein
MNRNKDLSRLRVAFALKCITGQQCGPWNLITLVTQGTGDDKYYLVYTLHFVMITSAAHHWFPPINWRTPGSTGPILLAYWEWLEEGSCRWPPPPLIQDGHHGNHLGFGFRRLSEELTSWLVRFFLWLIVSDWRKVPVDDQHRRCHGGHLGFGFRRLYDEPLTRLVISRQ